MNSVNIVKEEVPPNKNSHVPVWDEVMEDMKQRKGMGYRKYKTHLQPFNGRNALVDAYQEELDKIVYLRQMVDEFDIYSGIVTAALSFRDTGTDVAKVELFEAVDRLLEALK